MWGVKILETVRSKSGTEGKDKEIQKEFKGAKMGTKIDNAFLTFASDLLADTKTGLTATQIIKYCNRYAIDFEVSIPITSSDFGAFGSIVPNKRTALLKNLLVFNAEQQFKIIKDLCELSFFENNKDVADLKTKLYKRYGNLDTEKISDTELVQETKHWLASYPNTLKQYENALAKYEGGIFERNTLDDMRLSFELLVKDLLENNKSLENQLGNLGSYLKKKGTSEELRNMLVKIIEYYTRFQNNHVKHNDAVNDDEIEYVIELTSVVMKYLVKVLGKGAH
ncbi:hypothetical protein [Lancefieldella rimae]|uniref:hypothetical protein n=1 Tax=Lancefieldella rimae TaxID=1383 RepID=UPI00288A7752|nr:hypothetical protein [Lancefieldella rimae]